MQYQQRAPHRKDGLDLVHNTVALPAMKPRLGRPAEKESPVDAALASWKLTTNDLEMAPC